MEYDPHDIMQETISRYELRVLGIEDSEIVYPGYQVDAHVALGNGKGRITFAAKIYELIDGEPAITGLIGSTQNWDTGGSYLDPVLTEIQPPYD